jgi:hypothetical protein
MAGLLEGAIDALCKRELNGKAILPKVIASTATVKKADAQIQALFARVKTSVFPPQGPNRGDSFFSRTRPASEVPARLYLGVSAQGKNPKVMLRRTWLALMATAFRSFMDAGGYTGKMNPADPYMTVLGYFNSLRELGGARRILEEEVRNTLKGYGKHKRLEEKTGLFQSRTVRSEVMELTSRVPTEKVANARRSLGLEFLKEEKEQVNWALATNMISVGLDIQRLGLMVVFGQPKTHAEYIQATSRVGRDEKKPGLVVTLYNIHKPRDRSHYERFRGYHETFYRSVEASSLTPFSSRALDRGFSMALVTLARFLEPSMTPAKAVEQIETHRAEIESRIRSIYTDRVENEPNLSDDEKEKAKESVIARVSDLIDSWISILRDHAQVGNNLQYQKYELQDKKLKPLLRYTLDDPGSNDEAKFRLNRSLRDVEPEVHLFRQK